MSSAGATNRPSPTNAELRRSFLRGQVWCRTVANKVAASARKAYCSACFSTGGGVIASELECGNRSPRKEPSDQRRQSSSNPNNGAAFCLVNRDHFATMFSIRTHWPRHRGEDWSMCLTSARNLLLSYNERWAKANSYCAVSANVARSFLFMAIPATQMRPGMIIKHNDQLHLVFKVEHRTPGNLRAFIQAKLRNIRTGAMFEHRFRSADAIEKVVVDEVSMDFLYADGDDYYFMNPVDYEQTVLKQSTLGDAVEYLTPNLQITVSYFDGKAVGIDLPGTVELTVVETEPGIKSATASSVTKPAKLETGLVVQVPPFINEGEKIRVDTAEGAYLSRA